MDTNNNFFVKKVNPKKNEIANSKSRNSLEEDLVKDLEESLKNTVQETLNTLNSLIDIVKTKIDDPSVLNQVETIVDSVNKDISNSHTKSVNQLSSTINKSKIKKSSEEE